jgi:hypothetical protein
MSDPFGVSFDLPTFQHLDSFRRNIIPGPIPSPTLLTTRVDRMSLRRGDLVSYLGMLFEVVRVDPEKLQHFGNPQAWHLDAPIEVDRVSEITYGTLMQGIPVEHIRDDSSFVNLGKFSYQWEEYLYGLALEDDNYIGSCSEMGWVAMRVDFTSSRPDGTDYLAYDAVLGQYRDQFETIPAAVIMVENDRGILNFEYFDTLAECDKAWSEYERDAADFYAAQDEEDSE